MAGILRAAARKLGGDAPQADAADRTVRACQRKKRKIHGAEMRYLRIKNWKKYQHYKDRNPPWIKLHREVLDDYDMACLQDASKLHLILIWLLSSQMDNRIPDDSEWVKNKIGSHTKVNLKELIDKGFLVVEHSASMPLANCSPETETEAEAEGVDKKESTPKRARRKISYTQEFGSFWKVFPPNGASKDEAQKSYDRAISEGADHGQIERSAGAYAAYLDRTATKTAHATTWLNQRRWRTDYGSLEKENGKSIIANAGPTFRSEAERIAAGFLSQPAGQGEIEPGIGPGLRIAEAIRENSSQP